MNSFEEARIKTSSFSDVCAAIDNLIDLADKYPNLIKFFENPYEKKESDFIEYQHVENTAQRELFLDRSHPIDTVILNNFKRKTDSDIESVKLMYGPNSDEYTRSHHALAIADADTIYFRNGAYKPETEEGRKLLAHELTHIAQNKAKEDYRNVTKEERENEAETVEEAEAYNPDKLINKTIGGKEYSLKESVWKRIEKEARRRLEEKIAGMEKKMPDEAYLKLLMQYEKWEEEEKRRWGK